MSIKEDIAARVEAWRAERGVQACPPQVRKQIETAVRAERSALPPVGFAALSPEQRAVIAARGGRAAHAAGHANTFTPAAARRAGARGGAAAHAAGVAHRWDSETARAASLRRHALARESEDEA